MTYSFTYVLIYYLIMLIHNLTNVQCVPLAVLLVLSWVGQVFALKTIQVNHPAVGLGMVQNPSLLAFVYKQLILSMLWSISFIFRR